MFKIILRLLFYLPLNVRDSLLFKYQGALHKYQSYFFCQNDLDLKLMKYIKKRNGKYLEIGAFDGLVGSVSLRLEKNLNWSGVLIEPQSDKFKKLKRFRGRKNICINSACTDSEYPKKIELSKHGRMSFINNNLKKININKKQHKKVAQKLLLGDDSIESCPNNTLTNLLINNKVFNLDLAIIDVEGSESLLLAGLNLKKININFICIETYNFGVINKTLMKNSYQLINKLSDHDYLYKKK